MTRPAERRNGMNIIRPDLLLHNADWLKVGRWDLPTTYREFMESMRVDPDGPLRTRRRALRRFMMLPAADRMPAGLKTALRSKGVI